MLPLDPELANETLFGALLTASRRYGSSTIALRTMSAGL